MRSTEPPTHAEALPPERQPDDRVFPRWFTILTAAVAALSLASAVFADHPLARLLASLDEGVVSFLGKVTLLGSSEPYLIGLPILGTVLLLLDRWRRLAAATFYAFGTIAASGIAVDIIKVTAGRLRPKFYLEEGLHGLDPFTFDWERHSFPSGHASVATAVAICAGTFFPVLRIPLALIAVAVGASRLALEVHYLSDVICGAYMAVPAALLVRRIIEALRLRPD